MVSVRLGIFIGSLVGMFREGSVWREVRIGSGVSIGVEY